MDYKDLIGELKKEDMSEESKAQKLKELQEYIKSQNHLYDDHGPAIIGGRDENPTFPES